MRTVSLPCLSFVLLAAACGITADADDVEDAEQDDLIDGKSDALGLSPAETVGVLRVVNEADRAELDDDAGLSTRVATNISKHRAGTDGALETADDDRFDDLAELDAVPYVGPTVIERLRAYAVREGYIDGTDVACTSSTRQLPELARAASLAVDSSGGAHIAWSNQGIGYTKVGTWQRELIYGNPFSGTFAPKYETAGLAVDATGGLHLLAGQSDFDLRSNEPFNRLMYFHKAAGGTWSAPEIIDTGSGYSASTIAVDSAGAVHIAYGLNRFGGQSSFHYAKRRPAGGWTQLVLGTNATEVSKRSMSMAVDAAGGVHLTYFPSSWSGSSIKTVMRYAYKAPAADYFANDTIEQDADHNATSYLAVDAQGGVHVSYFQAFHVRYAYKAAGGSWSKADIGEPGVENALALDGQGGVYVAFTGFKDGAAANQDLFLTHKPAGGAWSAPTRIATDYGSIGPAAVSMQFAAGALHAFFYDSGSNDYAFPTAGNAQYLRRCP